MWLHFGYGNIGKALVAPFLEKNIEEYAIVDLTIKRQERKPLELKYFCGDTEKIKVSVDVFNNLDLSSINVISTSVISTNIIHIVDKIQKIINAASKTVYVVSFENSTSALEILQNNLEGDFIVLDTIVDKISIGSTDASVSCEKYGSILIDNRINNAVDVKGHDTEDIEFEHDYKIFSVNSLHAAIAYAAYYLNTYEGQSIKYISETISNEKFIEVFKDEIFNSLRKFLLNKFNKENIDEVIERFINSKSDTIKRVGRNPKTKLARLIPFESSSIHKKLLEGNKLYK